MRKSLQGGLLPVVAVARGSSVPLHRQIYDAFRSMVLDHRLQPGQQIPSTRALADSLGISRIPALAAYEQLIAEGYIESRHGAGTFVTASLPDQSPAPLSATPRSDEPASLAISRAARRLPERGSLPWVGGSGAFAVGQLAYDHFPF